VTTAARTQGGSQQRTRGRLVVHAQLHVRSPRRKIRAPPIRRSIAIPRGQIYRGATGATAEEADAWLTAVQRERTRYVTDVFA
jgi:hypothetical protein